MKALKIITDIQFYFCRDFLHGIIDETLFAELFNDTIQIKKLITIDETVEQ